MKAGICLTLAILWGGAASALGTSLLETRVLWEGADGHSEYVRIQLDAEAAHESVYFVECQSGRHTGVEVVYWGYDEDLNALDPEIFSVAEGMAEVRKNRSLILEDISGIVASLRNEKYIEVTAQQPWSDDKLRGFCDGMSDFIAIDPPKMQWKFI